MSATQKIRVVIDASTLGVTAEAIVTCDWCQTSVTVHPWPGDVSLTFDAVGRILRQAGMRRTVNSGADCQQPGFICRDCIRRAAGPRSDGPVRDEDYLPWSASPRIEEP